MTVQIIGADRFAATLGRARRELQDQTKPNTQAGQMIARAGAGQAPVRSGRLAGSITATADNVAATITSTVPYAGVIHYGWAARGIVGRPFLSRAAQGTEATWVEAYSDHLQTTLDRIKGA